MVLINGERVEKKAQSFLARKPESESSRCSRIKLKSFDQDGVLDNYDQRWFQVPPDWPCWCQLPLELGDHQPHCHHHFAVIAIVDMKKLGGLLPHWPDPRAGEQTEPRKQICRFSCQASLLPRVSHPFSMMSP